MLFPKPTKTDRFRVFVFLVGFFWSLVLMLTNLLSVYSFPGTVLLLNSRESPVSFAAILVGTRGLFWTDLSWVMSKNINNKFTKILHFLYKNFTGILQLFYNFHRFVLFNLLIFSVLWFLLGKTAPFFLLLFPKPTKTDRFRVFVFLVGFFWSFVLMLTNVH